MEKGLNKIIFCLACCYLSFLLLNCSKKHYPLKLPTPSVKLHTWNYRQLKREELKRLQRDNRLTVDTGFAMTYYNILSAILLDSLKDMPKAFSDTIRHPKTPWIVTTNFNLRKPSFIILHHTGQDSVAQTLKTFTLPRTEVSAHYIIEKNGRLYHILSDHFRAWHAGLGKWGGHSDMNSCSIGIELDNNGKESFPQSQIITLIQLLSYLTKKYNIAPQNIIGHADIAPKRKADPSVFFPWKQLAEHGFGLWYDTNTNVRMPYDFNVPQALRIIGYDISDLGATIIVFRRHFLAIESPSRILSKEEKKILYLLYKQCL